MALLKIDFHPGPQALRSFAKWTLGSAALLALLLAWRGRVSAAWTVSALGLVMAGLGFVGGKPGLMAYRLWMGLALVVGTINSTIVLALFYYLVLSPLGLLRRLFGSDPLALREPKGSLWKPLPPSDAASYRRQF